MCLSHLGSNAGEHAGFVCLQGFWALIQKIFPVSFTAKTIWRKEYLLLLPPLLPILSISPSNTNLIITTSTHTSFTTDTYTANTITINNTDINITTNHTIDCWQSMENLLQNEMVFQTGCVWPPSRALPIIARSDGSMRCRRCSCCYQLQNSENVGE